MERPDNARMDLRDRDWLGVRDVWAAREVLRRTAEASCDGLSATLKRSPTGGSRIARVGRR
jgi:hypothetical protein